METHPLINHKEPAPETKTKAQEDVNSPENCASILFKGPLNTLDPFFAPRSVAVIGASETPGKPGCSVLRNLSSSPFGGTVYAVNPKYSSVFGNHCYKKIDDVPGPIDLAVVTTPAITVPGIIAECSAAKVKAVIVISAGFGETGEDGKRLERKIFEQAQLGHMRVLGPNCLGLMVPPRGFNATFAPGLAPAGNVAFISQSGALFTAILDWCYREEFGFSAFISLGSMLDVTWAELLDYLGHDPKTESILLYIESIGDARSFVSAAREVALSKPIIAVKAGRTEAGSKAALSHTGNMMTNDAALDAAFQRCGILRVESLTDLFAVANVLAKQPRLSGHKLAIITNGGGPGVLATDGLLKHGGELASLNQQTIDDLNDILPPHWSHNNPVDILGDASPERFRDAVEIIANDPGVDGLLVILTLQAMTDATRTAEELVKLKEKTKKPILASWMGGNSIEQGREILSHAHIPVFPYPDAACRVFNYLARYNKNLRALYETPVSTNNHEDQNICQKLIGDMLEKIHKSGRTILCEAESKQVLHAYGIPTVPTLLATNEQAAVDLADEIGYPVVVKVHSFDISHKGEVNGVHLDLRDERAVRNAFKRISSSIREKFGQSRFQGVTVQPMVGPEGIDLIMGSSVDPQFGPVLMFGLGGEYVEAIQDKAYGLPPLNSTLAQRMMEQTRIYRGLKKSSGHRTVRREELEHLLVRFSEFVSEQPLVKEVEVNPLRATEKQIMALDARIILHDEKTVKTGLPRPAIRPYPRYYTHYWKTPDGMPITIRPIRPEDEPLMVRFHETLSEDTVYQRYLQMLRLSERMAHDRLTRVCFNDYDREIALVADWKKGGTTAHQILGVARLVKKTPTEGEVAIVISDRFQGHGLGSEMMRCLIQTARNEGIKSLTGETRAHNQTMLHLAQKLGFKADRTAGDSAVKLSINLE